MNTCFTTEEQNQADEQIQHMWEDVARHAEIKYLDRVSFNIGAKQCLLVCHQVTENMLAELQSHDEFRERTLSICKKYLDSCSHAVTLRKDLDYALQLLETEKLRSANLFIKLAIAESARESEPDFDATISAGFTA
jgi:hypothetical protein